MEERQQSEQYQYDPSADERLNLTYLNATALLQDRDAFFHIFAFQNVTQEEIALFYFKQRAKAEFKIGTREFDRQNKNYRQEWLQSKAGQAGNFVWTKYSDIEQQYRCGDYIADDTGIHTEINENGDIIRICAHPIYVGALSRDIDTGIEKACIYYKPREKWQHRWYERAVIADKNKIITLANDGVDVTSDTGKELVKFLRVLINLNTDIIPIKKGITRLGWYYDEFLQFIPYTENENICLDYAPNSLMGTVYDAIDIHGDEKKYLETMRELRKIPVLRLMINASLGSPLLPYLKAENFVVYVYGLPGSGKTLGTMAAAAQWGNPERGKLWGIANQTGSHIWDKCAFCYNLPVLIDDDQTRREKEMSVNELIMGLCAGVGRGRANASGRSQGLGTWNLISIMNGEKRLIGDADGGGTSIRTIEACLERGQLDREQGARIAQELHENYGWGAFRFIKFIQNNKFDIFQGLFNKFKNKFYEMYKAEEKQNISFAVLMLADYFTSKYIFEDKPLNIQFYKDWVKDSSEISIAERAYKWLIDYIAANKFHFVDNIKNEIWGKFEEDYVLFNKSILQREGDKYHYDMGAYIKEWAESGYLIKNSQDRFVHQTKCYNVKASYYKIVLLDETNV